MKAVWKHRVWQNFDNPAKLVLSPFYKGASLDEKIVHLSLGNDFITT